MQLQIFQVDAFTDKVFGGNPAAVCPLQNWLLNDVMQRIAMENCVAETVFSKIKKFYNLFSCSFGNIAFVGVKLWI